MSLHTAEIVDHAPGSHSLKTLVILKMNYLLNSWLMKLKVTGITRKKY
jgi:hypothetical protein